MRLVLDWDGTVTERDTLDLVLEAFGDAEVYERAEGELEAGTMTLNDVIAAEFATFRVVCQSCGSPRLASAIAGSAISESGSLPQRLCISL